MRQILTTVEALLPGDSWTEHDGIAWIVCAASPVLGELLSIRAMTIHGGILAPRAVWLPKSTQILVNRPTF